MKKEDIIYGNYKTMKARHGARTLVLFHVGEHYESYLEDAETMARVLDVSLLFISAGHIPAIRIRPEDVEQSRNRLLDAGYAVCVSEVRGASGRHILESL